MPWTHENMAARAVKETQHKICVSLFIGIVILSAASSPAFAQSTSTNDLPFHIVADDIQAGRTLSTGNDGHALITFEGKVSVVYGFIQSPRTPEIFVGGPVEFNVSCLPPGLPPEPPQAGEEPVPDCEGLKNASSVEFWADMPDEKGQPYTAVKVYIK